MSELWGHAEMKNGYPSIKWSSRPSNGETLSSRIVPKNFSFVDSFIIFCPKAGDERHVLTISEWEARQRWANALPWLKAFAALPFLFAFLWALYFILWLISPEVR